MRSWKCGQLVSLPGWRDQGTCVPMTHIHFFQLSPPLFAKISSNRVSPRPREITSHYRSELNRINKGFSSKEYQTEETTRENKFGANAESAMLI